MWHLLDATGQTVAQAPTLVLACAHQSTTLLQTLPAAQSVPAVAMTRLRGQVTQVPATAAHTAFIRQPKLPVAGNGYVVPLPDGSLLCGATVKRDDEDASVRPADHLHNLSRAHRRGPGAICTLMNGTMPRIVMMNAEWTDGALTKYLYRRTHTQAELSDARLPDVLANEPPAYREAYTDLLHTRLFGLCLRSKTFAQWSRAVQQSGTGWPAYISKYLWRQVHGEPKGTKAGGVRGVFAGSDAGDEARPCEG